MNLNQVREKTKWWGLTYRVICKTIIFMIAAVIGSQVQAQDTAGRAQELVRRLHAEEASVRDAAAAELVKIGPDSVPALIA
jgi:hypothetical protein